MDRVPSISGTFLGTKCAGLTWGRRSYPSQRLIAMFLLLEYTSSGEKDSYLNERLEEDCMVIVPQHKGGATQIQLRSKHTPVKFCPLFRGVVTDLPLKHGGRATPAAAHSDCHWFSQSRSKLRSNFSEAKDYNIEEAARGRNKFGDGTYHSTQASFDVHCLK
jgi:hypothetical protein